MSIFLMVGGMVLGFGTMIWAMVTFTERIAVVISLTVLGVVISFIGLAMYSGEERAECEAGGGEYHREFSHYVVGYKGSMTPVYDTECVE